MSIINNYLSKIKSKLSFLNGVKTDAGVLQKGFGQYVKKYHELRGAKNGEVAQFKFDKREYKKVFKDFCKILKENEYDIKEKSIVLTFGEYEPEKRAIFENAGLSSLYKGENNEHIFNNNYVNWTVLTDIVNFDIAKEIVFLDSSTNLEKSGLKEIIDSIKSVRENSRISSIILRIKASSFFNQSSRNEEIIEKINYITNNYFNILNFLYKKFEFKVPVHIVLTEIEDIYGFQSFLKIISEEEKLQVFGISNQSEINEPYSKNIGIKINDDIKNTVKGFLSKKILQEIDQSDFKNILLFINNFFYVVDKLGSFVDSLFLSESINSSYLLRGVYFCGHSANLNNQLPMGLAKYQSIIPQKIDFTQNEEVKENKKILYFFKELYYKKIATELHFYLPSVILLKKNKFNAFASIFLLCIMVITFPFCFMVLNKKLIISSTNIESIFNSLSGPIEEKVVEKKSNKNSDKINLSVILNNFKYIENVDENKLSSSLAPLSLLSSFDTKMREFFERNIIVFELLPAKQLLLDKLKNLSIETAKDKVKMTPEEAYNNLFIYVKNLDLIEKNAKEINSYGLELNINNLNFVVQDLLDVDLSDSFFKTNVVIKDAEKKYNVGKVDYLKYKSQLSSRFEILLNKLINTIENEYIINDSSKSLVAYLDFPRQNIKGKNYTNYVKDVSGYLDIISKKIDFYSSSAQLVTAAGSEIKFGNLKFLMKNSAFLDKDLVAEFDDRIKTAVEIRNKHILEYSSRSIGPLFVEVKKEVGKEKEGEKASEKTALDLSLPIKSIKNGLLDLEQTEFFKQIKDQPEMKETTFFADNFEWKNVDVDYLAKNIDIYNNYLKEKINLVPDPVKLFAKETALLGLNQMLIRGLNTKYSDLELAKNVDTEKEALAFIRKKEEIKKIITFFSENDKYDITKDLKLVTMNKVKFYLSYFRDKVLKNIKYEPAKLDFSWWDGITPPAFEAYQVFDSRALSDYVFIQNQEIDRNLHDFILPLFEINSLAQVNKISSEYLFWKQIYDEFSSENKSNSFSSLNNFILSTLTTLDVDSCSSLEEIKQKNQIKNDFFAIKQREILGSVRKQCQKLIQNKILVSYNKLINSFNEKLAGRFPFVADSNMDRSEDVDDFSMKEFIAQFDNFAQDEVAMQYIEDSKSSRWNEAKEFIAKMRNVSEFMKFMLVDEKNPNNNSFDIVVDFNIQKNGELNTFGLLERGLSTPEKSVSNFSSEKMISWSPSSEVTFSFRWAKDYEQFPMLLENINNDKYYTDLNDATKTVSFSAKNKWSIVYLIRKHAMNRGEWFYSQGLSFKVPVKNYKALTGTEQDVKSSLANILVKLKFVNKNKKTTTALPVFPVQTESIRIANL